MTELKSCPFCGGKVIVIDKSDKLHNRFYPSCTDRNCLGRNRHKYFPSEQIAILAWNRRKPPCHEAEHDAIGCLGFGKGKYDDEPIDVCMNCSKYTGNISEELDSQKP